MDGTQSMLLDETPDGSKSIFREGVRQTAAMVYDKAASAGGRQAGLHLSKIDGTRS
ncbi:hypothetical protein SBC2_82870 (plasmid) [Caballeronia sp. SBC2]|nr:hypothetical protein SBC2_82870 [Caballeronia sp. SBC2]